MGVADVFFAGLAGELDDEGSGAGRELGEFFAHGIEVGDGTHAFAASAEFAGGLGASEEEFGEDGDLRRGQGVVVVEAVLVFGDAGSELGDEQSEVFVAEGFEAGGDGFVVELEHGGAVALLVAGVDEAVEGERVEVWRGGFLFDEAAEDTGFD